MVGLSIGGLQKRYGDIRAIEIASEIGYSGVYNMELVLSNFWDNFLIETAEFAVKVMKNILRERYD